MCLCSVYFQVAEILQDYVWYSMSGIEAKDDLIPADSYNLSKCKNL